MPTTSLTEKFIASARAPAGKDRELFWEPSLPGFGLMVTANGKRSFVLQYRTADGISRRMTINGGRPLSEAKREAKSILGAVAKGKDPLQDKRQQRDARADTLRRIVEDHYLTDPDVLKLRSVAAKEWALRRYVFPTLGSRPIAEIKRSEIVRMLSKVRQKNGPGAADHAFKVLSRFFTWYTPRADDDFRSPIVRGTHSQTIGDGARTLSDDEIRILWNVASEGRNAYDHFVMFTLLTATRRNESAQMTRNELSPDGSEWTIPSHRYKGQDGKGAHAHLIPLSPQARAVLAKVPKENCDYIFTSNGRTPISGFSKFKRALDQRLMAALKEEGGTTCKRIIADLNERYPGKGYEPFDGKWQTHSLRKTARTLLSRCKIDERIAEKCLGHRDGGLVGTYNHHEAKPEKRMAFEALGREVDRIIDGGPAKVLPMRKPRA